MLPFLKNKQDAGVSAPADSKMRTPDDGEAYDPMHSAAEDLLSAIKSGSAKSVAEALRAAFDIADSEPHEEYEGED